MFATKGETARKKTTNWAVFGIVKDYQSASFSGGWDLKKGLGDERFGEEIMKKDPVTAVGGGPFCMSERNSSNEQRS